MDNINELLQKRAGLVEQGRSLTERAVTEKRAMSAEEQKTYDKIFDEITGFDKTIENVNRQKTLARAAAEAELETREMIGKDPKADAAMGAWRSFLTSGKIGEGKGAAELRALQADVDTDGGFTVAPKQFVKTLLKNVDDLLFIRQKATVWPLNSADSLGIPTLTADSDDAEWTAEIKTGGEDSSMKFGTRELKPKPLAKRLKVSKKLLRLSALPIEQIIADRLAYKLALPQEKAFLTGSGVNSALGLFTASNDGIPTSRDISTGNTPTSITFDGLYETKYALKAQYQNKAEWLFHRDAVKQIVKLKDGNGVYIWQPSVQADQPDRLLGRPVNMSEYAPNTFTTGLYAGLYGDLSYYWITESLDMQMQVLMELYAETNQVGYIVRAEVDGAPVMAEAFARIKLG